ncbi:hypothetical protein G6011_11683 [Alternaria panax]|uniref:Uncharacterized protein n=1 Tax=Alternaria panax TaxID=48097 RepID=A0AAD4IE94_9PLEO|nr:hypothetical protein G6011_11683 [Alternaria panax]
MKPKQVEEDLSPELTPMTHFVQALLKTVPQVNLTTEIDVRLLELRLRIGMRRHTALGQEQRRRENEGSRRNEGGEDGKKNKKDGKQMNRTKKMKENKTVDQMDIGNRDNIDDDANHDAASGGEDDLVVSAKRRRDRSLTNTRRVNKTSRGVDAESSEEEDDGEKNREDGVERAYRQPHDNPRTRA